MESSIDVMCLCKCLTCSKGYYKKMGPKWLCSRMECFFDWCQCRNSCFLWLFCALQWGCCVQIHAVFCGFICHEISQTKLVKSDFPWLLMWTTLLDLLATIIHSRILIHVGEKPPKEAIIVDFSFSFYSFISSKEKGSSCVPSWN